MNKIKLVNFYFNLKFHFISLGGKLRLTKYLLAYLLRLLLEKREK